MKASSIYGPQPIKVESFDETESITGIITEAKEMNFASGRRIVLTLDDEWTLIVNGTARQVITKAYGDETDDWIGLPLTAYKGPLYYNGTEKDGVCVRIPPRSEASEASQKVRKVVTGAKPTDDGDDLIAF